MPPKMDQAPVYIDGSKMDWSMDDGLYSHFQDWRNCRAPESQHTNSMGWIIQFKQPQGVAEG